ncbi:hypothetical protein RJ640_029796 [Escallonia rubra]|uniref:Uncharacterized protein n=1 Tax=Escallonia rubra TaxID=112253 RepID=A0AA88RTF6_9ASTE|nr:hypothetical protein RJ640_029796 [Escallonia rubra]
MNLNCLTCQSMQRTDSDGDLRESKYKDKAKFGLCLGRVERSWSGNLLAAPRPYEKMRSSSSLLVAAKKVKKAPHRIHSSGPVELEYGQPRLVRSSGMRRDWSFEDLRQRV